MINKKLLQVNNLTKIFRPSIFAPPQPTINNINLTINEGEILGLVGHSGSGKSTLAKILIRLISPSSGEVIYKNQDIFKLSNKMFRPFKKDFQMVFQNPLSSFNNLMTVDQILSEGIRLYNLCDKSNESDMINHLLNLVGLSKDARFKKPSDLSGGECQRVSIARSLSVNPKFIIFDEPTSALDVIVSYKIINIIKEIQKKSGITYLFISHNINLVKEISDRIAVMENGKIVEIGTADDVYFSPSHPFTQKLISAFRS